jgi:hypothetical protein
MICSDGGSAPARCPGSEVSAPELEAQGWQRCFVVDEPRLSEAVAAYQELGFDVRLVAVPAGEGPCSECMKAAPDQLRLIYTRRSPGTAETEW